MTTQYAILEQENVKNALLIQLNQVVSQIKHAMLLAHQNHHPNTCMNAIGLPQTPLAIKLKMVLKQRINAIKIADHTIMESVTILKRNVFHVIN